MKPSVKRASDSSGAAKSILRAETSSAVAVHLAARKLAPGFESWEPETLWIELEHQGVDLPTVNRDKLMAAVALDLVPSFYWDAMVFEKTALAFNDVSPSVEALEEASPERLAWAVAVAERIRRAHGEGPLDFEHEPTVYAATVLHRAGLVTAPPQLKFCQGLLDGMTKDTTLKERVASAETYSVDHPFQETPVDVQCGMLTAIREYIRARELQEEGEVSRL